MLQIRDENHKTFPGIEVGDLGPKLGDHANDTGAQGVGEVYFDFLSTTLQDLCD